MPEITTLEVTPGEIKQGDLIDDVGSVLTDWSNLVVTGKKIITEGRMVENVDRGPELIKLTTTGGRIVLRRTTEPVVSIRREVQTEAEKMAEVMDRIKDLEEKLVVDMKATANSDPMAWFTEKMEHYSNDIPSGFGWNAAGLVEMGVRKQIGQTFMVLLEREGNTVVDCARLILKEAERKVVSMARQHGESRSTSRASNLAADIELATWAGLIDGGMAWHNLHSVIWWHDELDKLSQND